MRTREREQKRENAAYRDRADPEHASPFKRTPAPGRRPRTGVTLPS
jgi:hypothetical protein